jgi:hypothetical protein
MLPMKKKNNPKELPAKTLVELLEVQKINKHMSNIFIN